MDNKLDTLLRRQKVLADFGDFALQSEDLQAAQAMSRCIEQASS